MAVDIECSTARTNTAKTWLRHTMYDLVENALRTGGITEEHRDPFVDRGDGILTLIHPVDQAPKTRLLNPVIPTLSSLLADRNAGSPGLRLRLRAVLHAGEIHYDRRGCFGEALDVAFRLLDAPEVKTTLSNNPASLVLVASDDIYRSIIRHGYDGIDDRRFEPLLRVQVADQQHVGWVHVPGHTSAALTVIPPEPAAHADTDNHPSRMAVLRPHGNP